MHLMMADCRGRLAGLAVPAGRIEAAEERHDVALDRLTDGGRGHAGEKPHG